MIEILTLTPVRWALGLLIWFVIGCAVLATIDDENESLRKWAFRAPFLFLYEIIVMSWPIILFFWYRKRRV